MKTDTKSDTKPDTKVMFCCISVVKCGNKKEYYTDFGVVQKNTKRNRFLTLIVEGEKEKVKKKIVSDLHFEMHSL